jgi:RimJ/RimL family protein N-acetyltransferase
MKLRPATAKDAQALFDWRNDPVTRAMSVSGDPVDWEEHLLWLESALASPVRSILIAEDGVPHGTVRLDRDIRTEVSITLAPSARGLGLAAPILRLATDGRGPFVARIRPDNAASRRAFEAAGFTYTHHGNGMDWFAKTKD